MPWPEKTELPKGYIVKLYKRVANVSEQAIIKESMFMTWMNFDCMDIVGIHDFQEYNNSVDLSAVRSREIYASRQKLFLYRLEHKDEFLLPNKVLEKFPLITLTMLDIQRNTEFQNEEQCGKQLQDFLNRYETYDADIRGEVYGSLSAYDYVLVLRGNDYRKIDKTLARCRQELSLKNIIFNKMYTIAGIDCENVSAWNADGMKASVRLSCRADVTAKWLRDNVQVRDAFDDCTVFSIMGKYDFDIIGEIKSAEKFVNLFKDHGALSASWEYIHKTNTRFLNEDSEPASDSALLCPVTEEENQKNEPLEKYPLKGSNCGHDRLLTEFIALYSKIDGLSPSVRENLSRLILRIYQVITTNNHSGMVEDLKKKLRDFLDYIYIQQCEFQESDLALDMVQDEYAHMISDFNLLLDNRVSAGMSDFETPQNVLRYSGSSMKVLLAYSTFVDHLILILSQNKRNEAEAAGRKKTLKYLVFVTADPAAKIYATVSLSFSEQYRFIKISIPVDLMFEVRNVLPWITHEAGHFIRAGWSRADRNAAYFQSVCRGVARCLKPYTKLKYSDHSTGSGNKTISTCKPAAEHGGMKFDDYREYVKQYFQVVIYQYSIDYSLEFQIPYNKARDLFSDVEQITSGVKRIYQEAIADMFMLLVLDIKKLNEYLTIQAAYFQRLNMDMESLPQENVSRIMAVSVALTRIDPDNYKQIDHYFHGLYDMCDADRILPILKKLKDYEDYYILEPLVVFLTMHVKSGLERLLADKAVTDIWQRIKESYSNLKKGEFEDYLEFVLGFDKI